MNPKWLDKKQRVHNGSEMGPTLVHNGSKMGPQWVQNGPKMVFYLKWVPILGFQYIKMTPILDPNRQVLLKLTFSFRPLIFGDLQLNDLRNFILANLFKFRLIPGAEFPSSSVFNNLLISDDIDGFHPLKWFGSDIRDNLWQSLTLIQNDGCINLEIVRRAVRTVKGLDGCGLAASTGNLPVRHRHLSSIWPVLDHWDLNLEL